MPVKLFCLLHISPWPALIHESWLWMCMLLSGDVFSQMTAEEGKENEAMFLEINWSHMQTVHAQRLMLIILKMFNVHRTL